MYIHEQVVCSDINYGIHFLKKVKIVKNFILGIGIVRFGIKSADYNLII